MHMYIYMLCIYIHAYRKLLERESFGEMHDDSRGVALILANVYRAVGLIHLSTFIILRTVRDYKRKGREAGQAAHPNAAQEQETITRCCRASTESAVYMKQWIQLYILGDIRLYNHLN